MILVTGATGFIGSNLMAKLLDRGLPVRALVRPRGAAHFLEKRGVEVVRGDITDANSLPAALSGVETVIHLVGLIREPVGETFESVVAEGTRSLVRAAEGAHVQRFVYVSAIGARLGALSRYHRTKAMAEARVRGGGFDHVIVRPSIVYGPGSELLPQFLALPLPIPGDGKNLVQPIHVDDLTEILLQCAARGDLLGQTIEVGGPEPLSFNEMIRTLGRVTGRGMPHPHLPMPVAEAQAWVFEALRRPLRPLGFVPPLTRDQLLMLGEDNVCDAVRVSDVFGFRPRPFEQGLRAWLGSAAAA